MFSIYSFNMLMEAASDLYTVTIRRLFESRVNDHVAQLTFDVVQIILMYEQCMQVISISWWGDLCSVGEMDALCTANEMHGEEGFTVSPMISSPIPVVALSRLASWHRPRHSYFHCSLKQIVMIFPSSLRLRNSFAIKSMQMIFGSGDYIQRVCRRIVCCATAKND